MFLIPHLSVLTLRGRVARATAGGSPALPTPSRDVAFDELGLTISV